MQELDFSRAEDVDLLSYGRVIMFMKAYVESGHKHRSELHELAFIEELWEYKGNVKCQDGVATDVGCRRLYGVTPRKVYYVIPTERIIAMAPVIRDPCHGTIPFGALPRAFMMHCMIKASTMHCDALTMHHNVRQCIHKRTKPIGAVSDIWSIESGCMTYGAFCVITVH